jgi:N-acetylneuraminic acid mutarotase
MRRRSFLASGLGLVAGTALQGFARATPGPEGRTAKAAAAAVPLGKWVSLAPFPEALEEVYGAAADGRLYVFSGLIPVWKPAGVVYQYDPGANAWTKRKPMAHPLHHPAVSVLNGKVYFFGGFVLPESGPPGWVPINDAWEYSPSTDAWRALAPMPTKRGAAAAAEAGGKFYVVGGAAQLPSYANLPIRPIQPHRSMDTVEEYDPVANTWRPRAPMPTARNHLGAAALNGKIYAIGGRLTAAFSIVMPGQTDAVQEYDPAADSWATKAPMPTPRSGGAVAVLNNRIYAAGGEVQTYQFVAAFRAFEAYDPAADTWAQLPYMPSPRHSFAMAAVGNRIHIVSGDVQSAMVPLPGGASFVTNAHDAFEVAP